MDLHNSFSGLSVLILLLLFFHGSSSQTFDPYPREGNFFSICLRSLWPVLMKVAYFITIQYQNIKTPCLFVLSYATIAFLLLSLREILS